MHIDFEVLSQNFVFLFRHMYMHDLQLPFSNKNGKTKILDKLV